MIARGVIDRVNDALKCQGVQISLLADETRDNVEHFQEYGFTSHPLSGAEGLFLAVGANRSHGIVACVTDRRHRPLNMGEGDVCLYTDKGERVYIESIADIVHLGAKSGAEFVALANKVLTELQSVKSDFETLLLAVNNHSHAALGGIPVPLIVFTPHTPASVAATKVKAT
jgi:phage baseplate assembly protein V